MDFIMETFYHMVCLLFVNYAWAGVELLAFPTLYATRDQAQYCCSKYGMSLMAVEEQSRQDFLVSANVAQQLFGSSSKTGFWLGIFNDESNGGIYNARKQPISWENWHVPSLLPENVVDNETYVFNSTICAKADMTDDYSWRATSCDETLPYICEIVGNYTESTVDVGDKSNEINCPVLTQYKPFNIARNGNIDTPETGVVYAGTHGFFSKGNTIRNLGSKLESHIVATVQDCLILCLNNVQCGDAILISNKLCMLYQSG